MGAREFRHKIKAFSEREAYESLVDEATDEHGKDIYNGTISTTTNFISKTNDYKSSGIAIEKFLKERFDDMEKRDCEVICIKPPKMDTRKIKTKVKTFVQKGKANWKLQYVVERYDGTPLTSEDTKGAAIKEARKYTERTKERTHVYMARILDTGSTKCAEIEYKANDIPGEYIVYGLAAE